MDKVIYVDFDGVLVDTPKLINKLIKKRGSCEETFKNFDWNKLLKKCNEIEDNFSYIKKISKEYAVAILTHVYSEREKIEKEKFIQDRLDDVKVIVVPYNVEKNKMVDPIGNILIDDFSKNINKWVESGGIGIHMRDEKRLDILLNQYIVNI